MTIEIFIWILCCYNQLSKMKISQHDKSSFISIFIKAIYGEYGNQSDSIFDLYKNRLQLIFT